jgi:hypothetical protein
MAHHRHMGQTVHPGHRTGLAAMAAAAAALGGSLLVTGCSSSVAAATTTLHQPVAVTVVHRDGAVLPGVEGLKLQAGDVVRTGVGGRASLVTQSRTVYVGSQAGVQVIDGARQALRSGAVVVDAQHGPGLDMSVASLLVTAPGGSAVRAERSVTVRVGALAGSAQVSSSTGRQVTIPALHQTMVGGDALPDSSTPLRLTDDAGEARAVPDLVRDDRALTDLARGIDSTGNSTAKVVSASWHRPLTAPVGAGHSERVLPAVIAAAGPHDGALDRFRTAKHLRAAGGSWGVIARLVGVRASGVLAALAAFERGQPAGHVGSVREILAGFAAAGPGTRGATSGPGDGARDGDNGGKNGNGPGGGPGGGGPTPSPSPTSSGLLGTVTDTVGEVISIVPTPSPTSTGLLPDPEPSLTVPSLPVPKVTLPGLAPSR